MHEAFHCHDKFHLPTIDLNRHDHFPNHLLFYRPYFTNTISFLNFPNSTSRLPSIKYVALFFISVCAKNDVDAVNATNRSLMPALSKGEGEKTEEVVFFICSF